MAGAFGRAGRVLREAASQAGSAGDMPLRFDALVLLAEAERGAGDPGRALEDLAAAAALLDVQEDPRRAAKLQVALGGASLALGHRVRASQALEAAARAAAAAGAPGLEAAALADLASLRFLEGDAEDAAALFEQSATRAREAGDGLGEARALANAGRVAGDDLESALALLQEAGARVEALPPSHARGQIQLNLAVQARTLATRAPAAGSGLRRRAFEWLGEALDAADTMGDDATAAQALGTLASLYADAGRVEDALTLVRRAQRRARGAGAVASLYRWYAEEGRLLSGIGDREAAIAAYDRALDTVQTLRHRQRWGGALRASSFETEVEPVFFAQVELLLARAAEQGQDQSLLLRARDRIEQLKAAELRDYFRDDCVDALRSKLAGVDRVSTSAMVLYPIALPSRLVVLASFPSGKIRQFGYPVGRGAVEREAVAFREEIERASGRRYLPHARRLYDWLIGPLESELRASGVDTLVFVPEGALLTIPMAALHDGSGFLIERFAVATTPGLELTDPRPLGSGPIRALLGGLSESRDGFAPLPHVAEEIAALEGVLEGEVLLDTDFRKDAFEASVQAEPFGVVHLATHAVFAGEADEPFLLAWDGPLSIGELSKGVGTFRFRDQPLELLTLSACETARGDERAALGFSGIAVQAGARSALGTLWSVNDPATAALVADFYRRLTGARVSRAQALQQAQQALLADFRYRHPVYWAPYVLIGSWL